MQPPARRSRVFPSIATVLTILALAASLPASALAGLKAPSATGTDAPSAARPAGSSAPSAAALYGSTAQSHAGSGLASKDGTYFVRVPYKSPRIYEALVGRGIEILAMNRDGFLDVLVEAKDLDFVMTLGVPVSIVGTPDMPAFAAPALDANLGLYHTYAEMETVLTGLEADYPLLADLSIFGTSIEGRNLYCLKISDNVIVDEEEPEVLYMGCHHAREIMSVDIPLRFAVYLLDNYGVDPVITDLVDTREIFFIPMLNPDGHYYRQTVNSTWRKNRRYNWDGSYGVDLNRNYSYMWGYDNSGSSPTPSSDVYRGTAAFSEPETQAFRVFCQGRDLILGFSYHSYGELLLFPWGYQPLYTEDHELFVALGDTLTYGNDYFYGNTAMGAIYPTNGDSDDWAYGETTEKPRFFLFTPEVNSSVQGGFAPADTYIQPTFDLLLQMNVDLLHFADNPYRIMPPPQPDQYAIDDSRYPYYTVRWSSTDPMHPSPAVGYDVLEYRNVRTIPQDGANALSDLWLYDEFVLSTARKYEGTGSYYSGMEDQASHTLRAATFYRVTAETDTFTARVWYDIEAGWDYAYLELSDDGARSWVTLPGNITTNYDPNGNNRGNGITGMSGGWILAVFPLTSYVGQDVELRFNYVTDYTVLEEGLYVDLPGPVPTYDAKAIVAVAHPDTTLDMVPNEETVYSYQVRSRDAEDQTSAWTAPRHISIETLTSIDGRPALASRLGANYPNPFNPVTRIPYSVGSASGDGAVQVTLAVYDVSGRRVATLVNRSLPPGTYEAQWTGVTDGGGPVSSGVYFARLIVGDGEIFTRKLVLLK